MRADPVTIADSLVGVHATDPASVYMELRARAPGSLAHDAVAKVLYEDRSLVKVLGMRRTMFVTPVPLAGIIHAATAADIAVRERNRLYTMLEGAGITPNPARWVKKAETETVRVLEELGEATAADLTKRVPELREQISFGEGKTWAGKVGVSTRLLFLLSSEGGSSGAGRRAPG